MPVEITNFIDNVCRDINLLPVLRNTTSRPTTYVTITTYVVGLTYKLQYKEPVRCSYSSRAGSGVNSVSHIRSYLEHYSFQNITPANYNNL